MKKVLIVIVVILVLLGIYAWSAYNGLVSMKEAATAQWQQVETQYQRRLDLIPNLVASVQGAMKQEQAVFTALADAPAPIMPAPSPSMTRLPPPPRWSPPSDACWPSSRITRRSSLWTRCRA